MVSSSVLRQKGESQNGCFKKTKYVTFSEKQILTPEGFSWNTRFEIRPFASLPTSYKQISCEMHWLDRLSAQTKMKSGEFVFAKMV